MKNSRIAFLILGILILPAFAYAKPQVAVLDTVIAAGMDKTVAVPITDKLIEELVNSGKYTVIDRANVEQVLREKEFQLSSGVVKNEEMRQAGEYLGADLVVVANTSRVGSTYVISAKMIDVVTGEIVAQASSEQRGSIDVVLDVARAVGRQIAGQKVTVEEQRARELVQEPAKQAPAAPAAVPAPSAGPAGGNAVAIMQMQTLIQAKAHMRQSGQLQMMSLADQLSDAERLMLYSSNRKNNAGVVLLLNWLVPSLGSWIQGDTSGALVELSWLTLGIVGVTTGYDYNWYSGESYSWTYYAGVAAFAVYVIYYCVRPFTFQRQWNTNLARGLKTVALSVLDADRTTFDVYPTDHGPEWKMGLSLVSFEY
jgi:TolB-like protein